MQALLVGVVQLRFPPQSNTPPGLFLPLRLEAGRYIALAGPALVDMQCKSWRKLGWGSNSSNGFGPNFVGTGFPEYLVGR